VRQPEQERGEDHAGSETGAPELVRAPEGLIEPRLHVATEEQLFAQTDKEQCIEDR